MVKFEGALSDQCLMYRTKYSDRVVIIILSIILAIGLLVGLLLYVVLGYKTNDVKEIFYIVGVLALAIIILIITYLKYKKPRYNVCIELSADTEFIEYTVSISKTEKIPTNSIKKVIKIGQSYYILRKHGDISSSLMAEESLLKEGTIEEFEALFDGKIEIRTK